MSRFWPVIVLGFAPGCLSLPGDRPLPVQVIDAETRQPIRAASVQIVYAFAPSPWAARGSTGTSVDDGIARLRVSASDDPAVTLEVSAMGYMSEERPLPAATIKALEAPHLFENTDHRSAAVVVELYSDPRPTVELVLPPGYRGRVRAEVHVQDDMPLTPHQRNFVYEVAPTGAVEVVGPPILHRVFAPDFHLRYADASPLTQNARESEVGYWWLKSEGDVQVFLVGTKSDYDAAVRSGEATPVGTQRSGGGKGGGGRRGGGGGRRGGGGGGGMGGGMGGGT
jgi:uncharacterized membrane protein YgcG